MSNFGGLYIMDSTIKDKKFSDLFDPVTSYPAQWILNGLGLSNGKICHLCICGFSHRVWYIAREGDSPIKPFVINSLEIKDGECLDGKWCLDTKCKYNKTTAESYLRSYKLSDEDVKEIREGWEQFIENISGINDILKEYGRDELLNFETSKILNAPGPLVEWIKTES